MNTPAEQQSKYERLVRNRAKACEKATTSTPHQRQGDRASGDDFDNDPDRPEKQSQAKARQDYRRKFVIADPPLEHLLDRHEVCAIANVAYPTLWAWMRAGTFPRARVAGGKNQWLASEVAAWVAALPMRSLKGDAV